jgi:hypothetical protein
MGWPYEGWPFFPLLENGMKTVLLVLVVVFLSGCAGLSVQWVASYSTTDLATALKMPIAIQAPVVAVPSTVLVPAQVVPK